MGRLPPLGYAAPMTNRSGHGRWERVQSELWNKPHPVEAARYDAEVSVGTIDAARQINSAKAKAIRWGIAAEAGAAIAVALAVAAEIFGL